MNEVVRRFAVPAAAACSIVAGSLQAHAVPLMVTLGGVVPAPPPAVFATVQEGAVLPLTFTVTNPVANGGVTLNFLAVANVPSGDDLTDTVMKTNQGGNCASGLMLAGGANCAITMLLTTDADGIPENSDTGMSTITVSAASMATGRTDVPFLVKVLDVPEPSSLALLGTGLLVAIGTSVRARRARGSPPRQISAR